MATDRIVEIAQNVDAAKRRQLYRLLDSELAKRNDLSATELSSLQEMIRREPVPPVRTILWRILLRQECSPDVVRFNTQWVREPSNPERGMALRFLRECKDADPSSIYQTFGRDPDPLVRYEAALAAIRSEPRSSLGTIIDVFADLPLYLQEEAEMYLLENAGREEVDRILVHQKLRGPGTPYDTIARSLELRLIKPKS